MIIMRKTYSLISLFLILSINRADHMQAFASRLFSDPNENIFNIRSIVSKIKYDVHDIKTTIQVYHRLSEDEVLEFKKKAEEHVQNLQKCISNSQTIMIIEDSVKLISDLKENVREDISITIMNESKETLENLINKLHALLK